MFIKKIKGKNQIENINTWSNKLEHVEFFNTVYYIKQIKNVIQKIYACIQLNKSLTIV